jgi:hypothetical protein
MRLIVKKRMLDDSADAERTLEEGFRIAAQLTGKRKKSELIRLAIWALIEREAARRLIAMGGSMKGLKRPRRRRSGSAA